MLESLFSSEDNREIAKKASPVVRVLVPVCRVLLSFAPSRADPQCASPRHARRRVAPPRHARGRCGVLNVRARATRDATRCLCLSQIIRHHDTTTEFDRAPGAAAGAAGAPLRGKPDSLRASLLTLLDSGSGGAPLAPEARALGELERERSANSDTAGINTRTDLL